MGSGILGGTGVDVQSRAMGAGRGGSGFARAWRLLANSVKEPAKRSANVVSSVAQPMGSGILGGTGVDVQSRAMGAGRGGSGFARAWRLLANSVKEPAKRSANVVSSVAQCMTGFSFSFGFPGTTSRSCSLDLHGVAYWGHPSYARCISNEYRHLQHSVKDHLAKGQRTLAGDGMSQVTKTLLDLTQRKNFYAGDLLASVEVLRNVTDTFKRASYVPSSDDVQIYPGSVELMMVTEDFIHIVGLGMKDFHNSYLMTGNLVASIQKLPAASVLTDINFPMKGRKGMVDWARNSEDKVVIPKGIFIPATTGKYADHRSIILFSATPVGSFLARHEHLLLVNL
ncbi:UNVERIFIED_CONTAM: hypothetical protein FKN15_065115 [Acipenser sinensis]